MVMLLLKIIVWESCVIDKRSRRSRVYAFSRAWSGLIGKFGWSGWSSWSDRQWEPSFMDQFSIDNDIRMIYFINTLCCLFTYCFIWFVSETRRFSVDNEIEASVPRTTFNDTLLSPVLPKPTSPYSRVSVPQTRTENVTGYNQNVRGCGSQRRHVVVNQRKLI